MTKNSAHSIRDRLLKLSKDHAEEFNFVLVRYGLERLLHRGLDEASPSSDQRPRTLTGKLGSAKLALQIDVGFGDAVTPAPVTIDFPTLLPLRAPRLRAYPQETVVAEKLQAMVYLGLGRGPGRHARRTVRPTPN